MRGTILLISILLFSLAGSLASSAHVFGKSTAPLLKLTLSADANVKHSPSNLPVKISFKNMSSKSIKILSNFDESHALPVFFTFTIKKDDGTSVFVPAGGKIDFAEGQMKYISLKKGEQFDVKIKAL